MSLEVLKPGWASRVVDMGRPHCRALGVPVGGAADRTSLALGNALVGNPPDLAALEVCLSGPRLRATTDTACVIYGAPFALDGLRPGLATGKTFMLGAGAELQIGRARQGMRAYLCVRGGIQAPVVLSSRSALDVLRRRELLVTETGTIGTRFVRNIVPFFADEYSLRVIPGLQGSWFAGEEFYGQQFTVNPASNRMGLRLQGEPLTLPDRELVSEPVAPGAVQVTNDGQCIVLGVDGQTIGGYPKIAQVIQADLDRLGQLRPGDRVRFERVTQGEAVKLFREQQALLRQWLLRLSACSG